MVGDGHQPYSRGLYTVPIVRIPYERWNDHPQFKEFRPWHIYVPFVGSRRSSGNLAGVGLGIPGH